MNKATIITGGPGTGKTTIISAIISVYEKVFGKDVLLMAPTGKAARRMTESTGHPASTIHSRLRIGTDASGSPNAITEGLVIIDEASMLDAQLIATVLDALRANESAHIVLVGDVDQLPSVGPGAVLQNAIDSDMIPTTKLEKIYRQAGDKVDIVRNARRIKNSCTEMVCEDKSFIQVACPENDLTRQIASLYVRAVKKYGIENVALLCPRRRNVGNKIPSAAESMNKILQAVINPQSDDKPEIYIDGVKYRLGDRVIQCKNVAAISNGDLGTIAEICRSEESGAEISIKWESGETTKETIATFSAARIQLAYAMSVHKSQGSEYACVIIPLISSYGDVSLQNNLLYTAVTRAKDCVVILGEKEAVTRAITNKFCTYRMSLLKALIKKIGKEKGFTPGYWRNQALDDACRDEILPEKLSKADTKKTAKFVIPYTNSGFSQISLFPAS